jgi:hypothetical protein
MALQLLTPLGDHAFLGLQLFGLLGQARRGGIDLADLLIDLSLPSLQACFALGKGPPHFGQLALPFDELLAEGGDSQAMFLARPMQGLLLFPCLTSVDLYLGQQGFGGLLTLVGVGMQFPQMVSELCAGLGQAFDGGLGLEQELGQLLLELQHLPACAVQLGTRLSGRFLHLLLFGQPARAFLMKLLPRGTELAAGALELFEVSLPASFALLQVALLACELGCSMLHFFAKPGQLLLCLLALALDLCQTRLQGSHQLILLPALLG